MTTREAIESALIEDPNDLASHAAYADLLHEQGDPRGDLIQAQLALEDTSLKPAERKRLQTREKELLSKHQSDWLGPLAPYLLTNKGHTGATYRFARGWIAALNVPYLPDDMARAMANAPQLKLCTELHLETHFDDITPLHRSPHLTAVRVLKLGKDQEEGSDEMLFPMDGMFTTRLIPDLVARMPHIEELHLWADGYDLGKLFTLPMPRLRYLKVYHVTEPHPLEVLAANTSLGSLTHLLFQPPALSSYDDDPAFTPQGIDALCRSPHLKGLTHLQIRMCDIGDPLMNSLLSSGLLGRLTHVDLRYGFLTDDSARRLAAAGAMPNLRRVDLTGNRLTPAALGLLRDRGWFHAANQWRGENAYFEVQFE